MTPTTPPYWLKQTADKPLFPGLLWSRPENKLQAGKLLIVGGNKYGFATPAAAYQAAQRAGIGTARLLLPDALRPYLGKAFDSGELAPSTPSGSFGQKTLAEMLDLASWADGVLLAGDFGRNSETAIVLEKFAAKYQGQLTITGDGLDYFLAAPQPLLSRPQTLVAASFGQLQKLAGGAHYPQAFTSQLDLLHFVELLHGFAVAQECHLLVHHFEQHFVAAENQIGSQPAGNNSNQLAATASATVWWLQNPGKPFEAITTSLTLSS